MKFQQICTGCFFLVLCYQVSVLAQPAPTPVYNLIELRDEVWELNQGQWRAESKYHRPNLELFETPIDTSSVQYNGDYLGTNGKYYGHLDIVRFSLALGNGSGSDADEDFLYLKWETNAPFGESDPGKGAYHFYFEALDGPAYFLSKVAPSGLGTSNNFTNDSAGFYSIDQNGSTNGNANFPGENSSNHIYGRFDGLTTFEMAARLDIFGDLTAEDFTQDNMQFMFAGISGGGPDSYDKIFASQKFSNTDDVSYDTIYLGGIDFAELNPVTPVPEPSTYCFLAFASVLGLAYGFRNKKAKLTR